jgi:small subunit ribosomal protein S6
MPTNNMDVKHYETVFILTPVLANEQVEAIIAKIRDFLLAKNAQIVHEEPIGLKKLAYPIQQKSTGIYHLIEFKAEPTVISVLETTYRREEPIIRFLTFSLDKHGIEYNEKKKTKLKQEVTNDASK